MTMNLLNPDTQEYERVDPQAYVAAINGRINALAYEASVIYWLTGEEKYAKFAADILNQWVSGVVYQEPIDGPGRTGFLDIQPFFRLIENMFRPSLFLYFIQHGNFILIFDKDMRMFLCQSRKASKQD